MINHLAIKKIKGKGIKVKMKGYTKLPTRVKIAQSCILNTCEIHRSNSMLHTKLFL